MKKKIAKRNLILALVLGSIGAFILYTVVFYSIKGWQWDGLFPYVLGVGGVVDVMTALVAIRKNEKEEDSDGIQNE